MLLSDAAGVGTLLVAGVEYSLSVDMSPGVGTEDTDSLLMIKALLVRRRVPSTSGSAISAGAGDTVAEAPRREALGGLPLGLLITGVESLEVSIASMLSPMAAALKDPDRVVRPLALPAGTEGAGVAAPPTVERRRGAIVRGSRCRPGSARRGAGSLLYLHDRERHELAGL